MSAFARLGILAAVVTVVTSMSIAAEKPFMRDDLADSAIRLESQIKTDAGQAAKPLAALRRDADAAFDRRDYRAGMQILGLAGGSIGLTLHDPQGCPYGQAPVLPNDLGRPMP